MTAMPLDTLIAALRASRGFAHKADIADVVGTLAAHLPGGLASTTLATQAGVLLGDDCAAIPDGDVDGGGYLLLAIEGLVEDFVAQMPWFAGYSALMVNLSDIAAMGGRPLAVVDALWSDGADQAAPMLQGLAAASKAYGVPIVGGHSNQRARAGQLAVAVLGRARRLLSSFAAKPGQQLMMVADLRGQWQDPYPFWDASTNAPAERLRADLALLPELAEAGLCAAAKDISMAGVLGTALMLLECSGVGARIELDALVHPPGHGPLDAPEAFMRWLQAFPSYGYLLSVAPEQVRAVQAHFAQRELPCRRIGQVTHSRQVWLSQPSASVATVLGHPPTHGSMAGPARPALAGLGRDEALLWDFTRQPFMGAAVRPAEALA